MRPPLAYFISWTCYGQRLHGDERGSVDLEHNRPGTPPLAPDPGRAQREREAMGGDRVTLSRTMRAVADKAICGLAAERGWLLLAQNARSTHIHIVVNCGGRVSPERAMAQFKARITRDLRRGGLATPDARLWTRHGSTRWINNDPGLVGAIAYVNDWQAGPGRELLEEHRRLIRKRIESLRAWLRSKELPEDGRTVVIGEGPEERRRRVAGASREGGSDRGPGGG